MKFYNLSFDEQVDELHEMWYSLLDICGEIEKDNPFYDDIHDLMHRIYTEMTETKARMPKDNTNEYLKAEYWRNQL